MTSAATPQAPTAIQVARSDCSTSPPRNPRMTANATSAIRKMVQFFRARRWPIMSG